MAARSVQAGTTLGEPKAGDGTVEMIRTLRVARRSAIRARTQAANQLHALVVTAPDPLRAPLRKLSLAQLVASSASFRPGAQPTTLLAATKLALKCLAVRYQQLTQEITALDAQLGRLVAFAAPALVAVKGMGAETAGALLVAAGDNPERVRSEAAFARLCGVAPVPASSGRTTRHRLSRGGNRDANRALYLLAIGRMGWDPRTRDYVERRTKEGLSKSEIIRCLKRYIAREAYHLLAQPQLVLPAEPLDNL
jgi:transposase